MTYSILNRVAMRTLFVKGTLLLAVALVDNCVQAQPTKKGTAPSTSHRSKQTAQPISFNRPPLRKHESFGGGGMVVADHETASAVGAQMLRDGGDAADAAVATALMLGGLQPFASGIVQGQHLSQTQMQ